MEKLNKKIIIALIAVAALVLVFLLQKTFLKSKKSPAQLTTTGVNLEGEKAMEAISEIGVPVATQETGLQGLAYKMENGTKVFNLTAAPVRWPILEDTVVTAWAYNGMVPGPLIRVTNGDKVRIVVKNNLPEPTTIHWHGIQVPNNMDGIPDETQEPIQTGETFTYEFVAKPAGTYWYHSHFNSDKQISVGLSGAFIIDPVGGLASKPAIDKVFMLNEWRVIDGQTYAAMPATGMDANFFTINGKAYPNTETITSKVGEKIRLRFVGSGQMIHPMHLHGFPFKIVATDGNDVPESAQWTKDVVSVAPGERYDIEFTPDRPGKWMLHCHIPHHTTNDHHEPGGLMMMINVI
ncbi:MAG: Multicopper oxidase, type 3 [Microgenomates group bacterium GW2011_GWC1_37_12b]|nr:MAG: Multicopper oxidase, type 3 [Microgenomates group bacterium GW2011_GWC1_37_12b]